MAGNYTEDLFEAVSEGQYSLVEFLVSPPAWCVNLTVTI